MKTLTLDLNKLSRAELEAYLMLLDKAGLDKIKEDKPVTQEQIKEDNKQWMKDPEPDTYP